MNRRELLVFEVAGSEFALDLAEVEEVVPAGQVTPIPDAPPFFLGLTAVRGKVMGVIDAARRYGIGPALNSHFLVCRVRGNLTAVAVDRPVVAGSVWVRELPAAELEQLRADRLVDGKFLHEGFELYEDGEAGSEPVPMQRRCLRVDADLFVSTEMASRVGEV